jgi:hypothetical protein
MLNILAYLLFSAFILDLEVIILKSECYAYSHRMHVLINSFDMSLLVL